MTSLRFPTRTTAATGLALLVLTWTSMISFGGILAETVMMAEETSG